MSKGRVKTKSSKPAERNLAPKRRRLVKGGASKAPRGGPDGESSCCVLITGFDGFPRARFNPTGRLVAKLARIRRPAFARARIVTHVFPTHYAAVDRDLPELIRRHRPDVILMLGLAPRSNHLRIEMRGRNALSVLAPDAQGFTPRHRAIRPNAPPERWAGPSLARLLAAVRGFGMPTSLSHDAGSYVCNYLYWRALEYAEGTSKPPLVQFVHVPQIRNGLRPRSADCASLAKLAAALQSLLVELIAQARHLNLTAK
jgi:pyroglutamyl-peptidase